MTSKQMPGWPDERDFMRSNGESEEFRELRIDKERYERARADAAMARLRVAVEALRKLNHPDSVCKFYAAEALDAIGPLPSTERTERTVTEKAGG